jgi:sarcosine oxidase, subunit gamma
MSIDMKRESPLASLSRPHADNGFTLRERPFLELASVRGNARELEFVAAVERGANVTLPIEANTVASGETYHALWLGPDEWLLQSTAARDPALEATLRPLFSAMHAAVVDVSSAWTVIELAGSRVRDVLRAGCPLDLHPRVFGTGQCAQSHFFKAAIVLRPLAADTFEAILRRSYAEYAVRMLIDAAEEFC